MPARFQPIPVHLSTFATAGPGGVTSLTYLLGMAWNMGSISVFAGWQDSGRDQQSYSRIALCGTSGPGRPDRNRPLFSQCGPATEMDDTLRWPPA